MKKLTVLLFTPLLLTGCMFMPDKPDPPRILAQDYTYVSNNQYKIGLVMNSSETMQSNVDKMINSLMTAHNCSNYTKKTLASGGKMVKTGVESSGYADYGNGLAVRNQGVYDTYQPIFYYAGVITLTGCK